MRVVFDTNLFIAAALRGGFAEDLFQLAATSDTISLITSEEILRELQEKLHAKFYWQDERIASFARRIRAVCTIVVIKERIDIIRQDPDDNKILECAVAGRADLIVSTDHDLIALKHFRKIAIVHPKTFSWMFPKPPPSS